MKKIAIFQTDLSIGGIQKSLVNFLNNLDYKKYSVDLYLFGSDNTYLNDIPDSVNVSYLKKGKSFSRLVYFNILNKFYKKQVDKKYDVAIDYNSYSMDTALATINCNAKKKVCYIHNDVKIKLKEEPKYRVLHHFFKGKYKYFDTFVGVSRACTDTFKDIHKLKDKEYFVIPNLINTDEIFKKVKEDATIKVDKKKYNLCSVGRLVHQKGFDILLMYIKEITKYRKDFHLYIIGDGEDRTKLEKQIKKMDISKYITICGFKPNPYAEMKEMDGFILTSRYEGQGMVFLEAKALGLDVYMPRNLEKYVDDVKGTDYIIKDVVNAKKRENKKHNRLTSYNYNVLQTINLMLSNKK